LIDDGPAVHYLAVERGTPVYSSDAVVVGTVDTILDNYKEHIFDGIVMERPDGQLRFVDAPEVRRTAERGVTLTMTAEEAEALPPPERGAPEFQLRRGAGRVTRFFGGGWKRKR
jgi:hypothetical protein